MTRRTVLALILPAVALAASTLGPAPRFDPWTILGPGGGGTMIAPTISPHDSKIVVEHCDMTGAYITLDGAQSWRMFNLRSVVNTFAFDPQNPRVIYAGNEALWRSEDTGRTWSMVFPDPRKNTIEHQNGDHADYSLTTGDASFPAGHGIIDIAVEAGGPRIWVAFAGKRGDNTALLYASSDRGASWSRVRDFPSEQILALELEPEALLVIGNRHVHRFVGGKWTPLAAVPADIARASAGRAESRTFIYATTRRGEIHLSEDGGSSWHLSQAPSSGRFEAIATSAGNGRVAYVGFRGMKLGEGTFNGISKTIDGGHTWTIVHNESNRPAKNMVPSWIESRAMEGGGDVFFDAPWSLGVAPADPNICYVTDLFRTYRTNDGGKSWETVNSVRVSDNSWTTRGLDVTTNYGVHFDPFDPQHLIISYTDIGAFHSYDGGSSWTSATNGVPTNWRNTTYWVVFDPEVRGRLWGAFSGIHDLPRPKMWRHRDPKTFVGGVGISNDGGKTWRPSHAGMPSTSVTHILLDPASPAGARTLYACGFGRGVYKSTDDGKTWTLKNQGLEDEAPFAWRLTRADDGTLYLVVARRSEGNYGDGGDGAIYRSRDGADHWEKIRLPENVNGPVGLTLDPRDNRRMYLSAWGQGRADVDVGGGVFLTTDAGTTWKPVFQQSQHVYDVTVDPENSRVIYAAGFDAGAWRSDDGGTTWNRLRGYTFKWGHRVVPDPVNPAMIYINTYGGSVWHGPARPAPDVPEDIQNPVPVASASPAQSAPGPRIVRPKEIDSVLVNPGIGFTTLNRFNGDPLNPGTKWTEGHPIEDYPFQGKLDVAGQPLTSIAYFRVYWKYVEPEMGQYNWKMLDAALRTAHERGQSLMLRVAPYGPEPKTEDVPDWYRKLVGEETGKAFPDKWRTDPEDPRYVKHWTNLVRALGARYDGHPDLDSVDVSIVGFWGEGEHTDQLSEPTMHVLVDSYLEAFTKTPLMMQPTDRRTNTYALSKSNAGWRADCLGDMRCVDGHWCHMFDAYPEAVAGFGIQEAWRKGPVSLEACWVMQGWKIRGWDIDYIIEQSLKWHISSFNNKSSAVPEEWWPQVRHWLNKMGYRFVLRRFTYPEVVAPHGKLEFTSWWENRGVAPCYRQFPLALRLRGEKRTEVLLTDADIRNWLPGDAVYDDAVFIPADLPAGRYDLQIGVLDPQTRRPKVKLAIEGIDGEGWYTLGGITVSSPASPSSAVSPK